VSVGALAAVFFVVALLAVAPITAAARPSDDLAANPGSLGRVPSDYRPEFRWWWPTDAVDPAELRTELRAIKAAGFGAVEQILLANSMEWGSRRFRARTRTALREANRLGLDFDITLGPGWPISSPSTEDLNREASVQDLHYGALDLSGPTTYSGPRPGPTATGRRSQASDRGDRHPGRGRRHPPGPRSRIGGRLDEQGEGWGAHLIGPTRQLEAARVLDAAVADARQESRGRVRRLARARPLQPVGDRPRAAGLRPHALRRRHGAAAATQRR
jgi:hypothetical protein